MSIVALGLLLAIFGWAWDARLIRSQILSLREREFTKTAVLSGTGTMKLVLNEYMPYSTPLIFSTLFSLSQQGALDEATGATTAEGRARLEAQVPMRRLGTLEEFASFCLAFLDGTSRFTTGQFVAYAGGWA